MSGRDIRDSRILKEKKFLDVEDLVVFQKLCQLHIEVCDLTLLWSNEERY